MACCAFAIFLLGQIYGLFDVGRRWLGIKHRHEPAASGPASWRPSDPAVTTLGRRALIGRIVLAASLGALLLSLVTFHREAAARTMTLAEILRDPTHWCGHSPNG